MSSFGQEMLRLLQPELLQPNEMINILIQKGVPASQLRQLDQPALLDIFKNTAVPKPQRKKNDYLSSDSSANKTKNRIVINSGDDRRSSADSTNGRRSSADYYEKQRVSGSDRLKPPPNPAKSSDYSSLGKSPSLSRLKPPPDLSQPEAKKIKLNRSSSDTLDSIIIKDRSRDGSSKDSNSRNSSSSHHSSSEHSHKGHSSKDYHSRDHDSKTKISLANGTSNYHLSEREDTSHSSAKKVTLKRNFDSTQPIETTPRKKQPITWP